jgi:sugar O-acyltransferase (sialic acid O-acetyltransferase NeuD family)
VAVASRFSSLVLLGGGSLAYQTARILKSAGRLEEHAEVTLVFDDSEGYEAPPDGTIRPFSDWQEWVRSEPNPHSAVIVGLGYHHLPLRASIVSALARNGWVTPNAIHPSAILADPIEVDCGVVIFPGAIVDFAARLDHGCIMNAGSVVCHDSTVGAGCFLGPGTTICGDVRLGPECFVGAGTVIRNGVSVGAGVRIAMGSVVTADLPRGSAVAGNPAIRVNSLSL